MLPGWLRWHLARVRLTVRGSPPPGTMVRVEPHNARLEDFPPTAAAYERLATLWEDYASWFRPAYGPFLAAATVRGRPLTSVLDLACGTGLLTRDLARHIPSVVGLDRSTAMLREARRRASGHAVRFIGGDFRDFALGETFQAIICCDSLNYLTHPGELADVCRHAAAHLSPGGFFVFDAHDEDYFRQRARAKITAAAGGASFEAYLFYDAQGRAAESRVILGDVVERHRRVPIDPGDVRRAAATAGLQVTDFFSARTYLPTLRGPVRLFYVLRRG